MKKLSLPKFLVLSLFAFTFSFTNISCIGDEPWTNTTYTEEETTPSTEQENEESGLSAPTGVTVKASSNTNYVTVKWTNNEAPYYWIYYNSTNDCSTATLATTYGYSGIDIKLSESGTYYFWVKAADGNYYSSSATSDFSEVATYTFTKS